MFRAALIVVAVVNLPTELFARTHGTWALSLEAHALQSMKWLTELTSGRITNVSFPSSLWKAMSVAATRLNRERAIQPGSNADALGW